MAISEKPVRDATLLAIEEINASGGIQGRKIEAVVVDGGSDPQTFAAQARRLITQERLSVVIGCWTSASRKTVRPVFEQHDHLLFYPVQYEGLEQSPNIIYTGAAPNQQILPAVSWCFQQLGAREFFLVGSDYVFPRTANAIIRDQVEALRGRIVGEEYVELGSKQMERVVQEIVAKQPDVVLNTINGESNVAFFAALREAGVTSDEIPTMSFSIAESELQSMDAEQVAGDYAAWTYFQSVARRENREFVRRFRAAYGAHRVTADPIEAGYFGVYLWKQAVEDAATDAPAAVRLSLAGQSFPSPQGVVSIDRSNGHTWKTVRIGRVLPDGQFKIVWTSGRPLKPVPFPLYRSRQQWKSFLVDLQQGWSGQWESPASR